MMSTALEKPNSDTNSFDNFGARPVTTWEFSDERGQMMRILVATTRAQRERAAKLAYRVYQGRGYVPEDGEGAIVSPFDADTATFTLLAEDARGNAAATITLAFDSRNGLPCDEIYGPELNALRAEERRLSEVMRLAIDEEHAHSKALLVNLFILCSVHARRIQRSTDFVIEVNPRHVAFYRRMLAFEPAGPERPCPRVQNAPAVLLRLDLRVQEELIGRLGGTHSQTAGRSLYAYFTRLEEEPAIERFLIRATEITEDTEKVRKEQGISIAIGVSKVVA